MNIREAVFICNPLASPNWPLPDESEGNQQEAIKKLAGEMLTDPQWLNTLESNYSRLDDVKTAVRDAMLKGNQDNIEIARVELVIAYRIAAHKQAAKELERERNNVLEDIALNAYEARMGCEA